MYTQGSLILLEEPGYEVIPRAKCGLAYCVSTHHLVIATLNIHSSMTATDVDEADQRLAELIVDILLTRATLDGNESEKEVSQQTEDEILSGQGAKGFSILTLSVGK